MRRDGPKRKLLSTHQVANLLGVSLQSVARWIDAGQLPASRTPGGHRRVEPAALVGFLEQQQMPIPEELLPERPTIVVVEDDPDMATWLVEGLQQAFPGHLVLVASDGFAAGLLIAEERPDVLVLDLYLAGLDGFEVCRRLKADPHTTAVRVIAITAHPSPEAEQGIREAGAEAFLAKPFAIEELAGVVSDLLHR
jgi:excisionase family DNA binding protein